MALTDESLLEQIAAALTLRPRSSLQDLAKGAGISRATLYRFAPTREQLLSVLATYAVDTITKVLDDADLKGGDAYESLSRVTEGLLLNRDLYNFFFTHMWEEMLSKGNDTTYVPPALQVFDDRMEAFFLRCQKDRLLRIDMPATWFNEVYGSILFGATRAISLGRVAPAKAKDLVLNTFFNGVSAATSEISVAIR